MPIPPVIGIYSRHLFIRWMSYMRKPVNYIETPFLAIIACALMTGSSFAGEQRLLTQKSSWKQINVGQKPPTKFRIVHNVMEISADKSVAFFYREIQPVMSAKPRIKWQWRIDRNIPATDQTVVDKDDRPIAVHLWFDDGAGSLFGSAATLFGYPRVGHLITYVWGGKRPSGTILRNPHYPKAGAIIILRNGQTRTNGWRSESRDIAADFKASFGVDPKLSTLRYIAVSGDTDDSQTSSKSQLRGLNITERR